MTSYADDHTANPCGICGAAPGVACPHDDALLLPWRPAFCGWRPYEPSRDAERTAAINRLRLPTPGEPACTECGERLTYSARLRGDGMCGPCSRNQP